MIGRAVGLLTVLLVLAAPTFARASGEYEPNDDISTAVGPLSAGTVYHGSLETDQDEDWFWAPFGAQQQITVSAAFRNAACNDRSARLDVFDGSGKKLAELNSILQEDEGEAQQFKYTTPPAPQAFFFQFRRGSGALAPPCEYDFTISPAMALSPVPAQNPVVRLNEPDDFKAGAHGPIGGEVLYAGTLETAEDVDQLFMDVKPNHQVHLEITSWGCDREGGVEGRMFSDAGEFGFEELATYEPGTRADTELEGNEGGRVYVAVKGELNCDWQLWAWPASSLSALAHTPPRKDPCQSAQRRLTGLKHRLRRLKKKLHRVSTPRGRGHIHHQIESTRRGVRAAKHGVQMKCR